MDVGPGVGDGYACGGEIPAGQVACCNDSDRCEPVLTVGQYEQVLREARQRGTDGDT